VSNPPYSAGKTIVNQLIEGAKEHLNKNGNLQIVGRKSKGGDMYKQKMIEVFGNCEDFGINSGFRVYMSFKK
ncbi:MAG: methyltransferase, partial [archaeon]